MLLNALSAPNSNELSCPEEDASTPSVVQRLRNPALDQWFFKGQNWLMSPAASTGPGT